MDRDILNHLPVVLTVAERQSFAGAASELGMSASAVSHSVRFVEERIGMPLFARTTRSVSLTDAGAALIETLKPALQDIADKIERVRAVKGRVGGLLRINAPRVALPLAVTPVLKAMSKQFPDVTVEVFSDDAYTDIVAEGFDAGIRLGELIAEDMVTVRLTPPFKAIIVASPGYLGARGRPLKVADLTKHNCIGFRLIKSRARYRWELQDKGEDIAIETSGSVLINDPLYARELAIEGIGLAYIFEPLVRDDIAAGRLTQVLPASAIEEPGLFLYYPKRASLAPKLRAFIDVAKETLRKA